MDQFSLQPDLETSKTITLDNNKIHIKRHGQHGFWKLNLDKGQLPEKYLGDYTSASHAEAAAVAWASEKKKTILTKV